MYDNVGGKIKGIAKAVAVIGIIASVLAGAGLALEDEDAIIFGLLIMILGSFVSWVSTLTLYGFGQLIENTDKLVEQNKKNANE